MSTTEYQVRPVTGSDRPLWDPLWQGYLGFYQSTLADEVTEHLWLRILNPDDEIQARVAESSDGKLVGLVQFFPHPQTWNTKPVCYLNDLFVLPEIRGGGIGHKLIDAVVEEARKHEWAEIYWHTQENNTAARGLYDKITGGTDGFINYTIDQFVVGSTALGPTMAGLPGVLQINSGG